MLNTEIPLLLEDGRYNVRSLWVAIALFRGQAVTREEWDTWRKALHLTPNEEKYYEHSDLLVLLGLVEFLNQGKTIEDYLEHCLTLKNLVEQGGMEYVAN